jgi:hypothetical protein
MNHFCEQVFCPSQVFCPQIHSLTSWLSTCFFILPLDGLSVWHVPIYSQSTQLLAKNPLGLRNLEKSIRISYVGTAIKGY